MSVNNLAAEVLQQAGTALHAKEIAKRMMDSGLWNSKGKTPDATIGARIYSDIKEKGAESIFVQVGPGTFALRSSLDLPDQANIDPLTVEKPTGASSRNSSLSFTDCAERVLEEFGEKEPMHYRKITEIALEKGWLVSKGKTPEVSMNASVITEIRRRQNRGDQPRFIQHGGGYVGLSRWMGRGLNFEIERHNRQVQKALRERLLAMTPGEFEELIQLLLVAMGFEMVELTKLSGDGGIDVRGILVVGGVINIKMAAQVKKWKLKNNITAPVVQQVRGSLGAHEQGLIITTSNFSRGAMKEASQSDRAPIALIDGERLVSLLMEHNIGVIRTTSRLFEIDEEFAPVINDGKVK